MSIKNEYLEEKRELEREEYERSIKRGGGEMETQPPRIMGILYEKDVVEIRRYLAGELGELGYSDKAVVDKMVKGIISITCGLQCTD